MYHLTRYGFIPVTPLGEIVIRKNTPHPDRSEIRRLNSLEKQLQKEFAQDAAKLPKLKSSLTEAKNERREMLKLQDALRDILSDAQYNLDEYREVIRENRLQKPFSNQELRRLRMACHQAQRALTKSQEQLPAILEKIELLKERIKHAETSQQCLKLPAPSTTDF